MTLGERIKIILSERNIKQVDFASTLGVSANYVNQLVNEKKLNISDTLAKLIEETYGYSVQWIITGEGEKNSTPSLSAAKIEFLKKIQKMPDDEVAALLAFANSLDSVKKSLGMDDKK
ncbi:helix-turn-helix domain-containing protein [Clostridioides difficile]|nr:XRE family transcriptional regulator [Clostridioides difficile]MCC0707014.1 helix-turn-helix transcriptional regulator [Clostridioides sp. ES-S-0190-01]MCC0762198.1 helix-turn-helix transcriptional regulator [Clostridioides sp. ES-S-0006-03]MBH7487393.1 helix-turn-helix transcriptional regulator [Clostridioides difficile]MBY1671762.1 helix-turn-helix domain-containing protein [Clostridioides difficile]